MTVSRTWPVLALLLNACIWGVSWWPFRELQQRGLHPLWATTLVYAMSLVAITLWRRGAWGEVLRTRSLWWLVAASGITNATFNWGVTVGDVVRVVLLFYLMPLWAVLLARVLLKEALSVPALLRVALALVGAVTVLWPPEGFVGGGLPLPRTLPEWLGIVGGFTFALNNVMLRRESHQPEAARALAMFLGGTVVSAVLATLLGLQGQVPPPPEPAMGWVFGALLMGAAFLASNVALQYGASRLPANVTAVVMLAEVLFASVSAVALGAGSVSPTLVLGGLMIVSAALLAGRE
jgi:drug/metabolite transporter (DMT)-like permease